MDIFKISDLATLINADCVSYMKNIRDNFYDIAITDPPYGISNKNIFSGNKKRKTKYKYQDWNNDIPGPDYFKELFRISKHQIIFGANYFYPYIRDPGRIIFYKNPISNTTKLNFSLAEIAYQSFTNKVEYFSYNWFGNTQGGKCNIKNIGPDKRIHPTQKPIAIYKWILKKYAKKTDKIIDTHSGSASSLIAALDFGCFFTAIEINEDYYNDSKKRIINHVAQLKLI